jgi:hypothetical protein
VDYDGDHLGLSWLAEDESHGQLSVEGRCGAFGGRASAWFNAREVSDFASALVVYPFPEGHRPELTGGYEGRTGAHLLVRISAQPISVSGQMALAVELADEHGLWGDGWSQQRVQFQLPVSYEGLRRFSVDLERVLNAQLDVAQITAERLA